VGTKWHELGTQTLPKQHVTIRQDTGRDEVKLTDSRVAALVRSGDKDDYVEWDNDLPGFEVRLRGDSKRWIVQ
jgi:hypothetical protein